MRLPEWTLMKLSMLHPKLFCQCARIFGRQRGGQIVLESHRHAKHLKGER